MNKKNNNQLLENLLRDNPAQFGQVLQNKDALRIQVIYTKIDRDINNKPRFTDYFFNVNDSDYFYPASTVKLPVALLALEKINELHIPGLDRQTLMDAGKRPSADETILVPKSVSHNAKEIFLISDNNAFNSLYEFVGQKEINEKLRSKGYHNMEIRHRLQISLTEEQNRQTNAIRFFNSNGDTVYRQPAAYSNFQFPVRETTIGSGYMSRDSLIQTPFSFSKKNKAALTDLHHILRSVIFPEYVAANTRFNLTENDYQFLYRYMSAYPAESKDPHYDTSYYDNYSKFLLLGGANTAAPKDIRIFNKEGDAYGFLTDLTYVVDFKNKVEFFLSATIYCNSDGVFNDDKYDYDNIGFPFMKNIGEAVYNYELKRKKKNIPDLSKFKIDYTKE